MTSPSNGSCAKRSPSSDPTPWCPRTHGVVVDADRDEPVRMEWLSFFEGPEVASLIPAGFNTQRPFVMHQGGRVEILETPLAIVNDLDEPQRAAFRRAIFLGIDPLRALHHPSGSWLTPHLLTIQRLSGALADTTAPPPPDALDLGAHYLGGRLESTASLMGMAWISVAALMAENVWFGSNEQTLMTICLARTAATARLMNGAIEDLDPTLFPAASADNWSTWRDSFSRWRTDMPWTSRLCGAWNALSQMPPLVRAVLDARLLSDAMDAHQQGNTTPTTSGGTRRL